MTRRDAGLGLVELVAVAAVIGLGLAVSLPAIAEIRSRALTAAGARRLVVTFQSLRWRSVAEARSHGMLFRRDASGWYWHEVRDGNGNGLRTAEVISGTDVKLSGPHRLERLASPARIGLPPWSLPSIPPAEATLPANADPVRFGNTDLVAFGPLGTSSSGTLFVTDDVDRVYGVVLYGRTGRVRVWHYEPGKGGWKS